MRIILILSLIILLFSGCTTKKYYQEDPVGGDYSPPTYYDPPAQEPDPVPPDSEPEQPSAPSEPNPVRVLHVDEVYNLVMSKYSYFKPGWPGLFLVSGTYHVYSFDDSVRVIREIHEKMYIPNVSEERSCEIFRGYIYEKLDPLASVGLGMSNETPTWFLVIMAENQEGQIVFFYYNPKENSFQWDWSYIPGLDGLRM